MKKIGIWIISLLLLNLSLCAYAVSISSVYSAEIAVPSQSQEDRLKAEGPALGQVLVKLSGDTNVTKKPEIIERMQKADRLVQEFSYSPSSDTPKTPYILHVVFDTNGVNRILRGAQIPTWSENRPLILAWISYEPPNQTAEIVAGDNDLAIQNIFKKHADQRGLPLLTPMLDIADINQVNVNDIVTMSLPVLAVASKRYDSDVILIVRILKNTDGYSIQSKMTKDADQWSWNFKGDTVDSVVSQLLNTVTNTLAGKFAEVVTDDVETQFTLKVLGITEQSDLASVMQYVKHLPPVEDVEPLSITNDGVTLAVSLRGSQQSFVQAAASEERLQPVSGASTDTMLVYQWNP